MNHRHSVSIASILNFRLYENQIWPKAKLLFNNALVELIEHFK